MSARPIRTGNGPLASDLAEMREIFTLVDKDGGGTISTDELGELLEIIGIEASKEELDKMVKQMDADDSGEIDFEGKMHSSAGLQSWTLLIGTD